MQLLSLPLADLSGAQIGIVWGLSGMAFGAFFGFLGMYFHHRRNVLWHETARLALEKGQPIPLPSSGQPGWNEETDRGANADGSRGESNRLDRRRGLLISGLVNLAVGAGSFIALSQISKPTAYFAAIPFFIGVALLLGAAVEALFFRTSGK